jgi:hypothetical protein
VIETPFCGVALFAGSPKLQERRVPSGYGGKGEAQTGPFVMRHFA